MKSQKIQTAKAGIFSPYTIEEGKATEYLNETTGEIVTKEYVTKVLQAESQNLKLNRETLKKQTGDEEKKESHFMNWNKKSNFLKVYDKRRDHMNKNLTIEEKGLLFSFMNFIEYETNEILIDEKPPSNKDIEDITGKSTRWIQRNMKTLKRKGIIKTKGRGKARRIFLNPNIFFRGKHLHKETAELFKLKQDGTPKDGINI